MLQFQRINVVSDLITLKVCSHFPGFAIVLVVGTWTLSDSAWKNKVLEKGRHTVYEDVDRCSEVNAATVNSYAGTADVQRLVLRVC